MPEKMATVAWQGISVKVPPDWSLVGVSGDEKKGYLRVDGPVAASVEVRWSPGFGKAPDLKAKCREFLSNLEKTSRKKRVGFSSKVKSEGDDSRSIGFNWRADRLGQGRMLYCPDCDRVVIAQVVSSREENVTAMSPMILGSLTDHRDDGWSNWALYGLEFAVPPGYRIEKHTMMSGYILLRFRRGAKMLAVQRWGLVKSILGSDSLEQWYRKDVLPDMKGYRVGFSETEIAGHEAIKVAGRRGGVRQFVRSAAYSLTLHSYPDYATGYAWHCRDSNRLFGVRATHCQGEDVVERIRDLIECHRGGPSGERKTDTKE